MGKRLCQAFETHFTLPYTNWTKQVLILSLHRLRKQYQEIFLIEVKKQVNEKPNSNSNSYFHAVSTIILGVYYLASMKQQQKTNHTDLQETCPK